MYKGSSLQKGLVSHWPLDQASLRSSTIYADKTPYGTDLTAVASPTAANDRHGQANKAVTFNGTDQYLTKTIDSYRSSDSSGSISFWINTTAGLALKTIFGSYDTASSVRYFEVNLNADNPSKLSFRQRNNDA